MYSTNSFLLVQSLEDVAGDLSEDRLLCPMRAVRVYLRCTEAVRPRLRMLFVSPSCSSRSLSKIALSYFVRREILPPVQWAKVSLPSSLELEGLPPLFCLCVSGWFLLVGFQGA